MMPPVFSENEVDDVTLGRRLAAARVLLGYEQKDVVEMAKKRGIKRGLGSSMVSKIERGDVSGGTDRRSARALCEIYEFDYGVLADPRTKFFAPPATGIIEQLQEQVASLSSVVSDVAAQVAAVKLASDGSKSQRGQRAEIQSE